jgi:hypothetical protein
MILLALSITILGVYMRWSTADTVGIVKISDLSDLIRRKGEYEGVRIKVKGTVRYLISFLMYEDFWVESNNDSKIPVEVRRSGLQVPPENAYIMVRGTLVHQDFEGQHYSIQADYGAIDAETKLALAFHSKNL